jgi:prepilin-type N-terminal cleavage/methylation domain-containing protein
MARTRVVLNESGFTMIELLIAIAIFAIGLMAMGGLQARTLMDTGDITRKTEAWTVVEDQAEVLKQLPFYQDVAAQTFPADLTDGTHNANRLNGRYTVQWVVDDDDPFPQQDETVLSGVPVGMYTVSKRIVVTATRAGGGEPLAQVEFVKVWAATGIP